MHRALGIEGLLIHWDKSTVTDLGSRRDRDPGKAMGGGELMQGALPGGGRSSEGGVWEGKYSSGI